MSGFASFIPPSTSRNKAGKALTIHPAQRIPFEPRVVCVSDCMMVPRLAEVRDRHPRTGEFLATKRCQASALCVLHHSSPREPLSCTNTTTAHPHEQSVQAFVRSSI